MDYIGVMFGKIVSVALVVSFLGVGGAFATYPKLEFTRGISEAQQKLLLSDITTFSALQWSQETGQGFQKFTHSSRSDTASTLLDWLGERVHIIVSRDFLLEDSVRAMGAFQRFPFSGELPEFIKEMARYFVFVPANKVFLPTPQDQLSQADKRTVMVNLSGLIYGLGKARKTLVSVRAEDLGWRLVLSPPHLGLLQVGPSLFWGLDAKDGGIVVHNWLHVGRRIGTLFHEARHGDGHGKHLAMSHVVCPSGHDLQGFSSCDEFANGSYGMGVQILKLILKHCDATECTHIDKEILRLMIADQQSRIASQINLIDDSAESAEVSP